MTTPYDELNSLAEFSMIGGETKTITFEVTDENDVIVDITGGTVKWVLAPYGNPSYKALEISGAISGTPVNEFTISIETTDTEDLSGKYIQQAVYTDFYGNEYRKQGFVTIAPRIE